MAKAKVWYENPKGAAPVQGLYSHVGGVTGGTLLFIAGQGAGGAKNEVVGKGDFAAQFRPGFKNLGDGLNGMGSDFRPVLKFPPHLPHSPPTEIFLAQPLN